MTQSQFLILWLSSFAFILACRVLPALALRGRPLSPRVTEALGYIPPAAFAALLAVLWFAVFAPMIKDASAEENRLSARKDIAQPIDAAEDFVPKSAVDKATVVRAVAIGKNGEQSPVVSNTYFVGFAQKADYYKKYKVVSLMTDEGNLFDPEKGIYVTGKVYDDWKKGSDYDPEAHEWEIPANYSQKGRDWEREAEIRRYAVHDQQYRNEISAYQHSQMGLAEALRKNTHYRECELYQRMRNDVKEFLSMLPESRGDNQQDTENLQSADQHQEG